MRARASSWRLVAGVTSVKPGDHVVLLWRASCGKCYFCTRGRPALCDLGAQVRWTGKLRDGTSRFRRGDEEINHFAGVSSFGEYSVLLADALIPITKDVPLEKAALVGCAVLTGVGAVMRTVQVAPGDSVAVIGTGGVGLNVIQGAVLAGAERIIAIDIRDNKLEHALQFGATHTVNSAQVDAVEAVRDLTDGRGADYAFEAIGTGPDGGAGAGGRAARWVGGDHRPACLGGSRSASRRSSSFSRRSRWSDRSMGRQCRSGTCRCCSASTRRGS